MSQLDEQKSRETGIVVVRAKYAVLFSRGETAQTATRRIELSQGGNPLQMLISRPLYGTVSAHN